VRTLLFIGVSILLIAACSSEEETLRPESLPLAEYLSELEAARERADARDLYDPTDGDFASEQGQQYLADSQVILRDFIAELQALVPPEQLEAAHERLLNSLRQADEYVADFLERAAAAETPEERGLLNAEFVDESWSDEMEAEFTAACSELQQAANTERIDVNLECPDPALPKGSATPPVPYTPPVSY
jgi:hypothetical protein